MPTQEIPRDQWSTYLSSFSASNQTRPVNVDLESNELGPQRLVEERPLLAVEVDFKDGEDLITVVAGDPQGGQPSDLTHEISDPSAIWIKSSDQGDVQALDIENPDGRVIVEFAQRAA